MEEHGEKRNSSELIRVVSQVDGTQIKPEECGQNDLVEFGTYPQDRNKTKAPICWRILRRKGKEALLISEKGLAAKPYHTKREHVTWEDCSLRKWLQTEFLEEAFTEEERSLIVPTRNWTHYEGKAGILTEDTVFILSLEEAVLLMPEPEDAQMELTGFAVLSGAEYEEQEVYGDEDWEDEELLPFSASIYYGFWWLRAPECGENRPSGKYLPEGEPCLQYGDIVGVDGQMDSGGADVDDDTVAVRPALWVRIAE